MKDRKSVSRYGSDLSILEAIGYREAKGVLNNNLQIDNAIELTTIKTNQFAKRQKHGFVIKKLIGLITKTR